MPDAQPLYAYHAKNDANDTGSFGIVSPEENLGEIVQDLFESAKIASITVRFVEDLSVLGEDESFARNAFEYASA